MIDQTVNVIGTAGVIAALVFSGLFGLVQSPLSPSDASNAYFSETSINSLSYLYYTSLYISFVASCYVVIVSFLIFHQISTWLPNRELRYWYIREAPILTIIDGAVISVALAVLTLIFAVAVNVGPNEALICFLLVLATVIGIALQFSFFLSICVTKLHGHTKELMNKQD
jgi:hypothetical protein